MCFICSEDVEREDLDWGQLGWIVRPVDVPEATGMTVLDVVIQPGSGHDFHRHPNQQETIYVVSGQVEQWLDREKKELNPRDAVFVPMDTVHATFVADDASEPANLLVMLSPSFGDVGYEVVDVATEEPWVSLRGSE